jgi:hypothetical protein
MHAGLARRVDELVECGWEPHTTTETSATVMGRRPFSGWVFLLVIVFFPLFGGILYLIFWLSTSRATVFLHAEGEEIAETGDTWLIRSQEAIREAYVLQHRAIKEKGFLAVMWPQLIVYLLLLFLWVWIIRAAL